MKRDGIKEQTEGEKEEKRKKEKEREENDVTDNCWKSGKQITFMLLIVVQGSVIPVPPCSGVEF